MSIHNIISVLLPVYNEELSWIINSIKSIVNQTYNELEILVLLDDPNRKDVIGFINKNINDNRVRLIVNNQNMGIVNNLNNGLTLCNGGYIARMDADDIADERRFELQMGYMKKYKVDFISSNFSKIDEDGNIISNSSFNTMDPLRFKRLLKYSNISCHPTWLFKKNLISVVGNYKNIRGAEDYEFICRLTLNGYKGIITPEPILSYRIRSNSISKTNELQQIITTFIVREAYEQGYKSGDIKLYEKKLEEGISDIQYGDLKEYYENVFNNRKFKNYYKCIFNKTIRKQMIAPNIIYLNKLAVPKYINNLNTFSK